MVLVVLDPSRVRLALAGRGPALACRLAALTALGASPVAVFAAEADERLAAGGRLVRRLPRASDLAGVDLLFVAGLGDREAERIAAAAKGARALVHVEDRSDLSDVHLPACLRRGRLLVAVATGGGSPRLAHRLREHLAGVIGPEWESRTEALTRLRARARGRGLDAEAVARLTDRWIDRRGWLGRR